MERKSFEFKSDPDVMRVFNEDMWVMMGESDRGAVLVGMSIIDQHLRKLLERGLPDEMPSNVVKRRLFEYPGILSSVSAKADVARAMRRIDKTLYESITWLRKLRNQLAQNLSRSAFLNIRTICTP
jgi:hypothetical protein